MTTEGKTSPQIAAAPARKRKPAAYLHTLHMGGGEKRTTLTFTSFCPWGVSGRDFDPSYLHTSEPLDRRPVQPASSKDKA